ncbi:hypothetical protein AB0L28_17590, partial [Streptomyces sp. NPDC052503]
MSPVVPGGLGGGAGRRPAGGGGQHRATPHTRRERRGRGGRTKAEYAGEMEVVIALGPSDDRTDEIAAELVREDS